MTTVVSLFFGKNAEDYVQENRKLWLDFDAACAASGEKPTDLDIQTTNFARLRLIAEILPKDGSLSREITRLAATSGLISKTTTLAGSLFGPSAEEFTQRAKTELAPERFAGMEELGADYPHTVRDRLVNEVLPKKGWRREISRAAAIFGII